MRDKKSWMPYLFFCIACLAILLIRLFTPYSDSLSWDVFGYYLYLPATFIYNDLGLTDLKWIETIIQKYGNTESFYQAYPGQEGFWVLKYPMGLSLFYAPFFLLAHIYAGLFAYPQDGFTWPYQAFISFGVTIYAFIGLYFFLKILKKFLSDKIVVFVILLFVFGTNYLMYSSSSGLMPHNVLFMLNAMLIWYVMKWDENKKIKYAVITGLLLGLITISRPNELICITFVAVWILWKKDNIKTYWKRLLWLMPSFFLIVFPQMLYWKITSGQWIFYSYQDPCEGFDFDEPYLRQFLFSYRKGWFLYTPLAVVSIFGFPFMYKKNKRLFFSTLTFLVLSVYIISSWSCWWYADGYSQRAVISLYIILGLSLGFLLDWISVKSKAIKIMSVFILLFVLLLNLFQLWQFNHGILKGDRMTKEYYWKTFGKTNVSEKDLSLLSHDSRINEDTVQIKFNALPKEIYCIFDKIIFSSKALKKITKDSSVHNRFYYTIDTAEEFSPDITLPYRKLDGDFFWLKVTTCFYCPANNIQKPPFLIISTIHKKANCKYYAIPMKPDTLNPGKWNTLTKLYLTPEIRSRKKDKLIVYIWNPYQAKIYISGLKAELYKFQGN
ncbi:MAG: hypothetical protein M0R16_01510 [Bacteroidales bacterium]|jgi:hypothetical protein|nr:hypothetical protein [Bacteroidales bacterium]